MRKFLLISILTAATSFAAIIRIDGFSDNQGPLTALGSTGALTIADTMVQPCPCPPAASLTTRTLELVAPAANQPPIQRNMVVDSGVLEINHGNGEDTTARVTYSLPQIVVPGNPPSVFFYVLAETDLGVTIDLELNGGFIGQIVVPPSMTKELFGFNFAGDTIGNVGVNSLVMTINGPAGYDVSIDSFGVQDIPEPGTMAMVGLAITALGLARRRRAA